MFRIKEQGLGRAWLFFISLGLCACASKPNSGSTSPLPQSIDSILHAGIMYDGGSIVFDFKDKKGLFWLVTFNHNLTDKPNDEIYEAILLRSKTCEHDDYSLPKILEKGGGDEKEVLSLFGKYRRTRKCKAEHQRLIQSLFEDITARNVRGRKG